MGKSRTRRSRRFWRGGRTCRLTGWCSFLTGFLFGRYGGCCAGFRRSSGCTTTSWRRFWTTTTAAVWSSFGTRLRTPTSRTRGFGRSLGTGRCRAVRQTCFRVGGTGGGLAWKGRANGKVCRSSLRGTGCRRKTTGRFFCVTGGYYGFAFCGPSTCFRRRRWAPKVSAGFFRRSGFTSWSCGIRRT